MFAFVAVALTLAPWLIANRIDNEMGVMGFGAAFLPLFFAGTFVAWVASLIMGIITLVFNRRALRTTLGIVTIVLDVLILCYAAFWVWLLATDLWFKK